MRALRWALEQRTGASADQAAAATHASAANEQEGEERPNKAATSSGRWCLSIKEKKRNGSMSVWVRRPCNLKIRQLAMASANSWSLFSLDCGNVSWLLWCVSCQVCLNFMCRCSFVMGVGTLLMHMFEVQKNVYFYVPTLLLSMFLFKLER